MDLGLTAMDLGLSATPQQPFSPCATPPHEIGARYSSKYRSKYRSKKSHRPFRWRPFCDQSQWYIVSGASRTEHNSHSVELEHINFLLGTQQRQFVSTSWVFS